MSTPYYPGYGQPPNYPTPKVNFGWIGEAWHIYTKAWLAWLSLYLIMLPFSILSVVYSWPQLKASIATIRSASAGVPIVPPTMPISYTVGSYLLQLVSFFLAVLVLSCGSDIALRQVRGESIEISSIFRGLRNYLQMFLYWILYFILLMVGYIACCIGINVSMGLLLPGYAMIADGKSAADTLSISISRMKGDWLNAALFSFVLGLLVFLGTVLTLYIGAFALGPMMYIISALAYRDMVGFDGLGPDSNPANVQGSWSPQ